MSYLILCHLGDSTALRVHQLLRNRPGGIQGHLATSDELIFAPEWVHHLHGSNAGSRVRLANNLQLDSKRIRVVFNRLRHASAPPFEAEADRQYALMEQYASQLSWLKSLDCPVVNEPLPRGLGSRSDRHLSNLATAARAGLPIQRVLESSNPRYFPGGDLQPYRRCWTANGPIDRKIETYEVGDEPTQFKEVPTGPTREVRLLGNQILGSPEQRFHEGLKRLAALLRCQVLSVSFGQFGSDWKVTEVDAFPHLTQNQELNLLAELLEARAIERTA